MSEDRINMTGMWEGAYSYPGHSRGTMPFAANIVDQDGHLSGTIIEPASGEEDVFAEEVEATVAGARGERSIDFIKTYRGVIWNHSVDYVGQLSADGQVVTGMWSVDDIDGTFEMRRQIGWEEAVGTEAQEETVLEGADRPIEPTPPVRESGCFGERVSRRSSPAPSTAAAPR